MEKKLLITGGAGFMGSHFIRYILEKYENYQITNLDKLTYAGNLDNLADIEKNFSNRYQFIKGDITQEGDVNKALKQEVDIIVNFAAETHVDRSILEPKSFLLTDIVGTYNLLEAVRLGKANKIIQISTDEVFGQIKQGEFFEDSPFLPNSPYSAAKASADLFCRAYWKTYQIPVIVVHSCNYYGTHQYPEKLIPLFITNLLEEKDIPIYGDGEQVREWIFTEDYCQALDLIMHYGKIGESYNIGTGQRKKNKEVAELILKFMNKDKSYIKYVKDRPGHDFRYAINSDKLRKQFNWKPQVEFEQGLAKTIVWYENNEDWWKKLKNGDYLEYYKKQYNALDKN